MCGTHTLTHIRVNEKLLREMRMAVLLLLLFTTRRHEMFTLCWVSSLQKKKIIFSLSEKKCIKIIHAEKQKEQS